MESERVKFMTKRAEIDTTAPFRSVKEAVTLFGERVLAGELYNTTKLKEMHSGENGNGHGPSKLGNVTAELEETKQSLQKAREESEQMANSLSSLKHELERTKKELRQLKDHEAEKYQIESEIEDVKFIEDSRRFEIKPQAFLSNDHRQEDGSVEFQKKRYVTFANPPSLAQVMIPQGVEILERHPSLKKKKKKPLIPLIGAIFSKKKANHEVV
ncbi:WEB family protein [Trema orientale]|uniref:WEB family protein n=1 Tax=Trema orientale TaxID=63057 RepID=A0A2P5F7V2_TREOI|nr:WEB family protein [Trema orientale]